MVNTHIGPNTEVEQFLGIPYALPPVGDRRFEYPMPPENFQNGMKLCFFLILEIKQDYSYLSISCLISTVKPYINRKSHFVMF